jgi:hypothetical protein
VRTEMGRSGYLLLDAGCPGWHSIRLLPSVWQLLTRFDIYDGVNEEVVNCVRIAILVG